METDESSLLDPRQRRPCRTPLTSGKDSSWRDWNSSVISWVPYAHDLHLCLVEFINIRDDRHELF